MLEMLIGREPKTAAVTAPGSAKAVVTCPECEGKLTVPLCAEAQTATCPACGRGLTVNSLLEYQERKLAYFAAMLEQLLPAARKDTAPQAATGPGITLDQVGGMDEAKAELLAAVRHTLLAPEPIRALGITPVRGVLLAGPPGCGKTLLARAVASRHGLHTELLNGAECLAPLVGKTEENLRKVFLEAERHQPALIVFDELDGIAASRYQAHFQWEKSQVAQLLGLMDGIQNRGRVLVVGTTNNPGALDPALLRPGRFDRLINIPLPDAAARAAILAVHCRRLPLGPTVALDRLAAAMEGYSGADLAAVCRDAALAALAAAEALVGADRAPLMLEVTELHFRRGIARSRAGRQ